MVYSLIQNFRITKPSIIRETLEVSHRNISCAARVCWTGKKSAWESWAFTCFHCSSFCSPSCSNTVILKSDWETLPCAMTDDKKTPSRTSSVFCFALIFIFRCTVSAAHLHNQETMWTHKREGKKRACCQGRDAACQNKHLGSTSKATNWLFLSSLSFSCVLEINHSWMFLK